MLNGPLHKIRIYSPYYPGWPSDGAAIVIFEQVRYLAEAGHQIELVCWKPPLPKQGDPRLGRVRLIPRPQIPLESSWTRAGRVLQSLTSEFASPELFYYPLEARSDSSSNIDLEIYHYSFAYPWLRLPATGSARRVVVFHNLESELFRQRAMGSQMPWNRSIHLRNAAKLAKHEKELIRLADELWFLSAQDLEDFKERSGEEKKLRLVPPIFDPSIRSFRARVSRNREPKLVLGFAGALSFRPNQVSAEWILRELAPLLAEKGGFSGEIRIAGRAPSRELQLLAAKFPFVRLVGFVKDMNAFYGDLSMVLSPHLEGSGVRIKLLDALASGIPVVTHKASLKQLSPDLRTSAGIWASDSAQAWASKILGEKPYEWRSRISSQPMEPALQGDAVYAFLRGK